MYVYILKRILLIVPTLLGIMIVNFVIIEFAPGGPVETILAQLSAPSHSNLALQSFSSTHDKPDDNTNSIRGLDEDIIAQLKQDFNLDKPRLSRFFIMLKNYLLFDFGESYFKGRRVITLILEKMPVSISLGLWSLILTYLISIPLGIHKAIKDGQAFDKASSFILIVMYSIPAFLLAVFLIILFAGGRYFSLFPLRGLTSDDWHSLSLIQQILDYFWHITLPVLSLTIGAFTPLVILTKNSFIDEIAKNYVTTARSKGLDYSQILYKHVFRNAMLIVIAGFPGAFISIFFTGSLLIEIIFSLNGLGLLGYEATIARDYPLIFATLYIYTLIGLSIGILSDVVYTLVDPRINFDAQRI